MDKDHGPTSWDQMLLSPRTALFAVADAAQILRVPRRKIVLFVEQGVLEPTVGAEGRGHSRKFSLLDLFMIALAARLSELGLAPRHIAVCVELIDIMQLMVDKVRNIEENEVDDESNDENDSVSIDHDLKSLQTAVPEALWVWVDENGQTQFKGVGNAHSFDVTQVPEASILVRLNKIIERVSKDLADYWR